MDKLGRRACFHAVNFDDSMILSAVDNREQHHLLQVPLQASHHPDLEICPCSFTVDGSKFWNSLPNSTLDVPTPQGLQLFKKAPQHPDARMTIPKDFVIGKSIKGFNSTKNETTITRTLV